MGLDIHHVGQTPSLLRRKRVHPDLIPCDAGKIHAPRGTQVAVKIEVGRHLIGSSPEARRGFMRSGTEPSRHALRIKLGNGNWGILIGAYKADTEAQVSDLQDRKDRELLSGMADGSEDAFVELYRRYSPAAMGLAYRVLGQKMLAEEVLQEVFVSVWRAARGYDPARGRVRTWLMSQIHHRAVDFVRREESQRRRAIIEISIPIDDTDAVVEEGWLASRRSQVRTALESLSAEQQQALTLAYFGGLTQKQISQATGVPLGTVKTRTMAAMRGLRELISRGES
ncbi:MAG: sigma-70 family RNA polymerase sigma factor [Actinomycetota bacterium]